MRKALWLLALVGCGGAQRGILPEHLPRAPHAELGRATMLVAFASDELAGELSPSGRQLVYASDQKGQLDVWHKDMTTGAITRLTEHPAVDTQPTFSPDGEEVVFVSMRKDAKGDLYRWRAGKLERLSDSAALEAFPRFGPDGALYYARGEVGRTRIERRAPGSKEGEPLTRWGATHPVVSADGLYLAFTWTDSDERARVVVQRLADRKTWVVTTPDYGAGFPTFSPDGRYLAFARFYRGAPSAPRKPGASSSLWRVRVEDVAAGVAAEALMKRAEQLTDDAGSVLLLRWHARGIVFTGRRIGSLDVGILPPAGVVPRLEDGKAQLALALKQRDPWARVLCLRAVELHRDVVVRAEASYLSAQLFEANAQFAKAARALERTVASGQAPYAALARLDSFVLPVAREAAARRQGRAHRWREAIRGALAQLEKHDTSAEDERVRAHHALLRADMLRAADKKKEAIGAYETLRASTSSPRHVVARATFSLGQLYAPARSPRLLARYYLTLFTRFPGQADIHERAARAALAAYASLPPREQVEELRALADASSQMRLFVIGAERRLAWLYERMKKLDLAVAAMARAVELQGEKASIDAFELGRLSLGYSRALRAEGRASEAMSFYAKALRAYERILEGHEAASEVHARAKREYTRLALLEASQLTRQGDVGAAEKRYRRLLAFDDNVIQAHRELIRLAARRGKVTEMRRRHRARLAKDAGNFPATYSLGLIATLGNPGPSELKEARRLLERAHSLRPQSPFPLMTLGWIFEMRERLLGEEGAGWLEEALNRYTRAYALNDAKLDPQTESDLLVNLANAYVGLGSDWGRVHGFCARRVKLGYALRSEAQEAYHLLACGRASSAVGRYAEARDRFERALELSERLKVPRLEAQLVARLGLNEHLRGDYVAADRLLRRALASLRRAGQTKALSGLMRTVAYNLVVAGRKAQARQALREAEAMLKEHGAPSIEDFIAVGAAAAEPSTAPFGYGKNDEEQTQLAVAEILAENKANTRRALALQEQRVALRTRAKEISGEAARELRLLRNRVALTALGLDDIGRFSESLELALKAPKEAKEKGTAEEAFDPAKAALELGLLLNFAEGLGRVTAHTSASWDYQRRVLERLEAIEARREEAELASNKPQISARLRIGCWAEIAALKLRLASRAVDEKQAKQPASAIDAAFQRAGPRIEAIRWLRRVVDATSAEEPPPEPTEAAEKRLNGTSAALWRPLSSLERARWSLRAALRLAGAATAFAPRSSLSAHASTALLEAVAKRTLALDLGALRFALAAELAYRRGDARALSLAVEGFLARSPLRLGVDYLISGAGTRDRIFDRAIAFALERGAAAEALAYAEQRERRAFVDALVRLSPRGGAAAEAPLRALMRAAAAYQEHYGRQEEVADDKERKAWYAKRDRLARRVAQAKKALAHEAPAVARLFSVERFPLKAVASTLAPGEAFVGAIVLGDAYWLYRVGADAKVRVIAGKRTLTSWRATPSAQKARAARDLGAELTPLLQGAKRLRIDFGRLSLDLAPETPAGVTIVGRLATLWEALDAQRVRRVALPGVVEAPRDVGDRWALEQALDKKGLALIRAPLRFDGISAANVAFDLPRRALSKRNPAGKGPRVERWRLPFALGEPLLADAVVVHPAADALTSRSRRVALARMLHAAGVPAVALALEGPTPRPGDNWFAALPSRRFYGYAPRAEEERALVAKKLLKKSVFAGARALNAKPRDLATTVFHLERALRFMTATKDRKFEDGALRFLTSAYTFQHDFSRGIRRMKELRVLREEAVKQAPPKKRLGAQAKLVKALQRSAWLYLRAKRYDEALTDNERAISVYLAVKRPLMARAAYDQRAVISVKKGDKEQALRYARKAYEAARALAARNKRDSDKLIAVEAATTGARILRRDFSRYADAEETLRAARSLLPTEDPKQRASNEAAFAKLRAAAAGVKDKKKLAALKRRAGKLRAAIALDKRVATASLDLALEGIRNQTARGVYGEAVDRARAALKQAESSSLPTDQPLLELVNNLYYAGDYNQALREAARGILQNEKKPRRRAQFLNAKGSTLSRLGRVEDALRSLRAALDIARRRSDGAEVAATQNNIGDALRAAGRFAEARAAFSVALALDEGRGDKLGITFGLTNLGITEALMGREGEAARTLRRALKMARAIGSALNEQKALAALAARALRIGRYDEARRKAEEGRRVARKTGNRKWEWRFELLLARAHLKKGQAGLALSAGERARRIVAAAPPTPQPAVTAARVWARPREVYDLLIDLSVARKDARRALMLIEEAGRRGRKDRLARSLGRGGASEGARALAALVKVDSALEALRAASTRGGKAAAKGAGAKQLLLERQEQLARLSAVSGLAGGWFSRDSTPDSAIRASLKKRSAVLIVLYATGERVVTVRLDGANLALFSTRIARRELKRLVGELQRDLSHFRPARARLKRLYKVLLGEALARTQGEELLIDAHGVLAAAPYAALRTGGKPLVASRRITHISSLARLANGGVAAPSTPKWASFSNATQAGGPLPYAARESIALGRTMSQVAVYQRELATRAAFAREAEGGASLHLATHHRFDPDDPFGGELSLHDGGEPLWRVIWRRSRARLVVLSSCNGGRDGVLGAPALHDLPSAFLAGGARRVVAALWRVSDLGAALLAKHLFRQLAAAKGPSAALRAAQLRLAERHPHPAFWAGLRVYE